MPDRPTKSTAKSARTRAAILKAAQELFADQGYERTTVRDVAARAAIDPGGTFLLAANQHSDTIVTFSVDPSSGALTPTGQIAHVPTPVCILFATK